MPVADREDPEDERRDCDRDELNEELDPERLFGPNFFILDLPRWEDSLDRDPEDAERWLLPRLLLRPLFDEFLFRRLSARRSFSL